MQKQILLFLLSLLSWNARATDVVALPPHVEAITTHSEVFGDGTKVKRIVLTYDAPIRQKSLNLRSFAVSGKEIVRIYANNQHAPRNKGVDGRYVIIELKAATNLNAQPRPRTAADEAKKQERDKKMGGPGLKAGWSTGGEDLYGDIVTIEQQLPIRTQGGATYLPVAQQMRPTEEKCAVVDDFQQLEFTSPYTGQVLPYNLYLPKNYDAKQQYPLVLFIHDAGVASAPVRSPLLQGRGAVTWAEPSWQAQHPCIVVAPQYPFVTVDDQWNYSHHLDATLALLDHLQRQYAVDPQRVYTTGQSMGCMSSMVLMLKAPQRFAGALLVAGKWNPEVTAPLAQQNVWIISCDGDKGSTMLQNQTVAQWRKHGAVVAEDTWEMTAPLSELSQHGTALQQQGAHLLYTHLTGGSHRATWFVAYDIPSVKEWLFRQQRQ